MKASLLALNRFVPLMMLAFLVLASVQVAMALHVNGAWLVKLLIGMRQAYPWIAGFGFFCSMAGLLFESRSTVLDRRGLRRRKTFVMDILARLTNRVELEKLLAQERSEATLDAEELASDLRARVVGQDHVCEDIAQQLRRRLALTKRDKPVGVFLFAGPPGTGKTYLAKQIALKMERPLLHFDMTQMSSAHAATTLFGSPKGYVGSESFGKLTGGLQEKPDSLVLLDEIEKAHPDVFKKFLTAWNDGHITEASNGAQISTTRAIFVLTSNIATETLTEISNRLSSDPDRMRAESTEALRQAGFAPEVLNRLDRIFIFRQLDDLNLSRVAALEIEAMIKGYDLTVVTGGIDARLLFQLLQRQRRLGANASVRDMVRSIEEMLSESLISARQQSAKSVRLTSDGKTVIAEVADHDPTLQSRLLP